MSKRERGAGLHPPSPHPVFRVGVTGHRPNRLPGETDTLRQQVAGVLQVVRDVVRQDDRGRVGAAPSMRLLSSLAEGTDRIAAHAALALGYTLQVALPFPQEIYEEDFATEDSALEFRGLLRAAESVFALDRPVAQREHGYRTAGHLVLQQSDLLIAVWDGEAAQGIGGTAEVIEMAAEMQRPVLCIGAAYPHELSFRGAADAMAALKEFLRAAGAASDLYATEWQRQHEREHWPGRPDTLSYTFLRLAGDHRLRFARAPKLTAAEGEIATPELRPFFGWTDALAVFYGERSRSIALRMQVLALVAVICAIMILPFEEVRGVVQALSFGEVGAIVWLLIDAARASRSDWHAKWLLYRSLAEKLRCLDFLRPIGETIMAPRTSGFVGEDGRPNDFADRFLQGVVRELGLVSARVDGEYLERHAGQIRGLVQAQARFQETVAHRAERVEEVLHGAGITLFSVAVLLCVLDVTRAVSERTAEHLSVWHFTGLRIATVAAVLPALGAALAGIATQGEYKRIASRAEAMSQTLHKLLEEFEANPKLTLRSLSGFSGRVAEVLTSEVSDWHVLVAARPPSLPT